MAAPYVVGTPTAAWNNGYALSVTINKPSGVQDGDYLVAFLRAKSPGATTDWASSGWTRISPAFEASSTSARLIGIFGRPVASAAALTDTDFTFSYTGESGRVIGSITIVRGVDLAAPVVADSASYGGTVISLGARIPSYSDSAGADSLALGVFGNEIVDGTTNATTITSAETVTTVYANDTADDGTVGTTGSRTAILAVSYAGMSTLPTVSAQWGTVSGVSAQGVTLKGSGNLAPSAAFTYTSTGLQITVNGSSSTDVDGSIASYAWTYGDGGTATGATPSAHTYASAGTYTVTLTVTDDDSATDVTSQSVTVPAGTSPPVTIGYTLLNPAPSNTYTLNPSAPTSGSAVSDDDWMIAAFALWNGTASITPPAGWTVLKAYATVGTLAYVVYGRIRQAGDASYAFTASSSGNVGAAALMWGSGADPTITNWIVGATANRTVSNQNTAPSLTTTEAHSLVLGFSMERTSASETAITSVTGATEWFFLPQYASSQIQTLDVATISDVTVPGATPAMTWTYPNTQAVNGMAFQIALPPASVSTNISVGYPGVLRTTGGVNYNGKMFYWDGTAAHDFSATLATIFNPVTVTEFLEHTPWFAAHRGFSYSYPEETLYSYRGATDWGIKAIEISVHKSSSGTFWCFHDSTTNRTTGVSGTISSMTDAQLEVLSNVGTTAAGNAGQPSRPAAKLVDVLDVYAATHVIIIEDKSYANTTALLDLMDAYGTVDRPANEIFIWKVFYGASKLYFYDPPIARGYHRWAYIFDADMAADFSALVTSGKADMIGMDYQSSDVTLSAAIADCITNSVMPTGHIVSSTTQRDRLLGLGMQGIMMSNKNAVPPWYNIW